MNIKILSECFDLPNHKVKFISEKEFILDSHRLIFEGKILMIDDDVFKLNGSVKNFVRQIEKSGIMGDINYRNIGIYVSGMYDVMLKRLQKR